jgi:hypothetical protein
VITPADDEPEAQHKRRDQDDEPQGDRDQGGATSVAWLGAAAWTVSPGQDVGALSDAPSGDDRSDRQRERNVHGEGQRLHLPSLEQVLLLDR